VTFCGGPQLTAPLSPPQGTGFCDFCNDELGNRGDVGLKYSQNTVLVSLKLSRWFFARSTARARTIDSGRCPGDQGRRRL